MSRSGGCLALIARGRRLGPLKPIWPNGLDCKSLSRSSQRHGSLPPQMVAIDYGGGTSGRRLTCRDDQDRTVAIVDE
jgi:hypothetical protein